jgi:hypothetical protein
MINPSYLHDGLFSAENKTKEEPDDLYRSHGIVRVIKSRIMRWAWNVACMVERCIQSFDGGT